MKKTERSGSSVAGDNSRKIGSSQNDVGATTRKIPCRLSGDNKDAALLTLQIFSEGVSEEKGIRMKDYSGVLPPWSGPKGQNCHPERGMYHTRAWYKPSSAVTKDEESPGRAPTLLRGQAVCKFPIFSVGATSKRPASPASGLLQHPKHHAVTSRISSSFDREQQRCRRQ
ncbi:unnamed protein product [Trichogramma brassicae]|uniref:Uncharacterized protein n=1 Tax=Trichogramma brassicae TaxID=86971 RepID=A0A6H5HXK0_9HYME|nr:unnamed protein product [Trichogramma brassicae]